MRNLGTSPTQARLEWYFIAHKEGGRPGPAVYIWDSGKQDISVAPGAEDKETLESTALAQTLTQTSTGSATGFINGQLVTTTGSGGSNRSGAKPAGWIVRLMDGDQILRVQSLLPVITWRQVGSDPVGHRSPLDASIRHPEVGHSNIPKRSAILALSAARRPLRQALLELRANLFVVEVFADEDELAGPLLVLFPEPIPHDGEAVVYPVEDRAARNCPRWK